MKVHPLHLLWKTSDHKYAPETFTSLNLTQTRSEEMRIRGKVGATKLHARKMTLGFISLKWEKKGAIHPAPTNSLKK